MAAQAQGLVGKVGQADADKDMAMVVFMGGAAFKKLVRTDEYLASIVRDKGSIGVHGWPVDGGEDGDVGRGDQK
jgi:hypothetical protein